jgi:hypothetical protein
LSARRPSSFPLVHLLLLVSVVEVAVNRLAVDALRPVGDVPSWHSALSYGGLFLYYFATTLAIGGLVLRAIEDLRRQSDDRRDRIFVMIRAIVLLALAAVATLAAADPPSEGTSFVLETTFALAVIVIEVGAVLKVTELGAMIGISLFAAPLLIHYWGTLFTHEILTRKAAFDSDIPETVQRYGMISVCIAALASPYCFAPRPITRSLPRPLPLLIALVVLAAGAILVRQQYASSLFIAQHGFGVDMGIGVPAGQMALYLLGLATVTWTIASCALAEAEPRRELGIGIALCVLGGYGFAWPLAFLLGVVGLVTIADAMPRLASLERGAGPRTPPIDDATWQTYTTGLTEALRKAGAPVSAVSARGEEQSQSTIIVTSRGDVPLKIRLERIAGALLCVDVVCGKDPGEARLPALTAIAKAEGWMASGSHPEPPPAAPPIRSGDELFDQRFHCRGDGKAMYALFDEGLRARATASLDGWVAYWPGHCLRWRLYPGMGAPLDHPVPVSDLVLRRATAGAADRLASVIELVAQIAARGDVARVAPEEPAAPDDAPPAA